MRRPWLDHTVRAATRYTSSQGNSYAAAISYFSVFAIVPLLMVAFAVAGYLLRGNEHLLAEIEQSISAAVPPDLSNVADQVITEAIRQRNAVGAVGLLLAAYSGLGWMTRLRQAVSVQWGVRRGRPTYLRGKLSDAGALVGLGLALSFSVGISALGDEFPTAVAHVVGLQDAVWAPAAAAAAGIVASLVANWLIFLWVIARLPREPVTLRSAARAAVVAAVGFELIQQVGTLYLGWVTKSPAGAVFGPLLGLLVAASVQSRFLLFVTAWAATVRENDRATVPQPVPTIVRPRVEVRPSMTPRSAAGLVGAGVLLGVLGVPVVRREHHRIAWARHRLRTRATRIGGSLQQ